MPNILIVDDSSVDRHLLQGLLSKEDEFEIIQAENGVEALAKIVEWNIDIVITDLQMPKMDGLQLVQQLRRRFPNVPAILITGFGSEKIATQALNAGATSYVPKSQAKELLAPTVKRVWELLSADRTYGNLLPKSTETKYEFSLENDASMITSISNLCEKLLSGISPLDRTSRLRVVLAIEHAINNALYRGNLEIGPSYSIPVGCDITSPELNRLLKERLKKFADRKIYILIKTGKSQLVCFIKDEGPGFDTEIHPTMSETGGRGLVLMHAFMDEVNFNKSGNEVTLRKRWATTPAAAAADASDSAALHEQPSSLGRLHDRKKKRVYQLVKPNLVIGSEETCHIVIKGPNIAPHHCQLRYQDGTWYYKALDPENEVFLNGVPGIVGKLVSGDKLGVGNSVLEITYQSAESLV